MKPQKKGPCSYSVLVVPEGSASVKRYRLTPWQLRVFLVFVSLGALFTVFNIAGFAYYRFLHTSLLGERAAYREFEREKSLMVKKMKSLEETVDETEKVAGRLAGLVGTERPKLKKGIGPLPAARFEISQMTDPVSLASLDPRMERLGERATSLEERIKELYQIQEDKVLYLAATPSIWPVKGWVTSEFGFRRNPLNFSHEYHEGVDIAVQYGTSVQAPADGVVTFAAYKGGLGKAVIIDHGFGIVSRYAHNSALFVHEGQRVKRGMKIAAVGNTGHSTGSHLHYEIHVDGVPVDPMKYVLQ